MKLTTKWLNLVLFWPTKKSRSTYRLKYTLNIRKYCKNSQKHISADEPKYCLLVTGANITRGGTAGQFFFSILFVSGNKQELDYFNLQALKWLDGNPSLMRLSHVIWNFFLIFFLSPHKTPSRKLINEYEMTTKISIFSLHFVVLCFISQNKIFPVYSDSFTLSSIKNNLSVCHLLASRTRCFQFFL